MNVNDELNIAEEIEETIDIISSLLLNYFPEIGGNIQEITFTRKQYLKVRRRLRKADRTLKNCLEELEGEM